ncbi:MAG: hypothetical protein ACLQBB_04945 [Solirubrobacteraceae bacterium]
MRGFTLDEQLMAGADPLGSRLLAARAAWLTSARTRSAMAAGLERIAGSADRPVARMRLSPRREAVLPNRAALGSLALRLRSQEPLYATGLARLARMLSDAGSPAFRGGPAELAAELASAAVELDSGAAAGPPPRAGRRTPRTLGRVGGLARPGADGSRRAPTNRTDPAGFVGNSFVLPNGSWYHGRREGS